MKFSIRKISSITGFSPATVSNALNNKKGVNRETAEEIWRVARETGYVNGARIKSIKFVIYKKDSQIVADTPFFSFLIDSVEAACREAGFQTVMCNINQNRDDCEERLKELIFDTGSGILLLATELTSEDMLPFESVLSPLVVLDAWFDNMKYDTVLTNNEDSVSDATNFLIQKGHRKIGYLSSSVRIRNFSHRGFGYRRAMAENGLTAEEKYRVRLQPTLEGARSDMYTYLLSSPELPTAYIADNDIIALGAMKALQQHGIQIPEDVSIIGFDDMPFCEISSPALTTIKFFQGEMGRIAVERLAQKIKGTNLIPSKVQVGTKFISRESVKNIAL